MSADFRARLETVEDQYPGRDYTIERVCRGGMKRSGYRNSVSGEGESPCILRGLGKRGQSQTVFGQARRTKKEERRSETNPPVRESPFPTARLRRFHRPFAALRLLR